MFKIFASLSIVILSSIWQCTPKQNIDDNRLKVIKGAIKAISLYDTTKLYSLVDTAYYFNSTEKEGFLATIKNIKHRFDDCGFELIDSTVKIRTGVVNVKEYIIPLCYNKKTSTRVGDLIFRFADYQNFNKIRLIYMKIKFDSTDIRPTAPSQRSL